MTSSLFAAISMKIGSSIIFVPAIFAFGAAKESLLGGIKMTQEEFSQRFKNSPVKRTQLKGLKRNAEFIADAK